MRSASSTGQSAIFYYPWYSTPVRDGRWAHWYVEREGTPVLSTRYPSRGLYSSSNVKIVAAQMHWCRRRHHHRRRLVVGSRIPGGRSPRARRAGGRTQWARGGNPSRAVSRPPQSGARGGGHRGSRTPPGSPTSTCTTPTALLQPEWAEAFRARGVRVRPRPLWDARKRRGSTASTRTTSSPGPAPCSAASAHRLTSPASCVRRRSGQATTPAWRRATGS